MKKQAGIVLLEVLLCVTVLSVGLIVIYQPIVNALSAISYAETRLEADRFVMNQMQTLKEYVSQEGKLPDPLPSGKKKLQNRVASYRVKARALSPDNHLMEIRHQVTWKMAGRTKSFDRTYILLIPYD